MEAFRKLMQMGDDATLVDADAWGIRKMFQHGVQRWAVTDSPRAPYPACNQLSISFFVVGIEQ